MQGQENRRATAEKQRRNSLPTEKGEQHPSSAQIRVAAETGSINTKEISSISTQIPTSSRNKLNQIKRNLIHLGANPDQQQNKTYTARFSSQDERPAGHQQTRKDAEDFPKEKRCETLHKKQFQKQRATYRMHTGSRNYELGDFKKLLQPARFF